MAYYEWAKCSRRNQEPTPHKTNESWEQWRDRQLKENEENCRYRGGAPSID